MKIITFNNWVFTENVTCLFSYVYNFNTTTTVYNDEIKSYYWNFSKKNDSTVI